MSHEPSWDLYRTFGAVMREGSLSGAARALGLTQPTAARHVEALEQALGAQLFLRTQRGLSPTEVARGLQPYAETLASTSAALLRAAAPREGAVTGTVRISASEVVGVEHLPPILAGLRQAHPGLQLELVLSNAVDDLLGRRVDLAVRMVEPVQQALLVRRVGTVAVGLHATRDYIARRGEPRAMADLADHDLIGFDEPTPAIRALSERFPTLRRDAFALRADSHLAQLAAVRAGFGIGFCQVPVARRDPSLVRVLGAAVRIDLGIWIAMHEDLRGTPSCRATFDALVAGLSGLERAGD